MIDEWCVFWVWGSSWQTFATSMPSLLQDVHFDSGEPKWITVVKPRSSKKIPKYIVLEPEKGLIFNMKI